MGRFRKVVIWLLIAFFVYAVFRSPDQAANIVRTGWDGIVAALGSIAAFFDALLKG
jgi:hypothetical protein